jgi:hypothetical protein
VRSLEDSLHQSLANIIQKNRQGRIVSELPLSQCLDDIKNASKTQMDRSEQARQAAFRQMKERLHKPENIRAEIFPWLEPLEGKLEDIRKKASRIHQKKYWFFKRWRRDRALRKLEPAYTKIVEKMQANLKDSLVYLSCRTDDMVQDDLSRMDRGSHVDYFVSSCIQRVVALETEKRDAPIENKYKKISHRNSGDYDYCDSVISYIEDAKLLSESLQAGSIRIPATMDVRTIYQSLAVAPKILQMASDPADADGKFVPIHPALFNDLTFRITEKHLGRDKAEAFFNHSDRSKCVDFDRAAEIFADLVQHPDIPPGYLDDGYCAVRAELLCQRIQQLGGIPEKSWALAQDSMGFDRFSIEAPDGNLEQFSFHIAPAMPVKMPDGRIEDLVLEPALFDGPVTLQQWGEAMKGARGIEIAPYGMRPIRVRGGYGVNCDLGTDRADEDLQMGLSSFRERMADRRLLQRPVKKSLLVPHSDIPTEKSSVQVGPVRRLGAVFQNATGPAF